jgi:hypothetical protein
MISSPVTVTKPPSDVADSEDELPGLPKAINRGDKGKQRKSERALSSSPPAPASNLPPPKIEYAKLKFCTVSRILGARTDFAAQIYA